MHPCVLLLLLSVLQQSSPIVSYRRLRQASFHFVPLVGLLANALIPRQYTTSATEPARKPTMHVPFAATLFTALVGLAATSPISGAAVLAREPQNGNRPVASGTCCIPDTSLKQDTCNPAGGGTGRCVPGGNNCKIQSNPKPSSILQKTQIPNFPRKPASTTNACRPLRRWRSTELCCDGEPRMRRQHN
jgi:hypothetical protein